MSENCMKLINLNVYNFNGKSYTFDVESTSTVEELSNKIVDSLGLLSESTALLFCGHKLDSEKRISDYKIEDGSTINLVYSFKPTMKIRVNWLKNDNKMVLAVNGSTTVLEVKKKIEEKLKVNANDQALMFNDDYLNNEKTLLEYKIVNDSDLELLSFE